MREKRESELGFGDTKGKRKKFFRYFTINFKQERKQKTNRICTLNIDKNR